MEVLGRHLSPHLEALQVSPPRRSHLMCNKNATKECIRHTYQRLHCHLLLLAINSQVFISCPLKLRMLYSQLSKNVALIHFNFVILNICKSVESTLAILRCNSFRRFLQWVIVRFSAFLPLLCSSDKLSLGITKRSSMILAVSWDSLQMKACPIK